MEKYIQKFKTLVIGAGPAGTGLLYNAISGNRTAEFLDSGIAFVDRGNNFGGGTIGKYMINSDTAASVLLECLQSFKPDIDSDKRLERLIRLLARKNSEPVPLEWVGEYLKLMGKHLQGLLDKHPRSHFFSGTQVISASRNEQGRFDIELKKKTDVAEEIICVEAESVVFAMGGWQDHHEMMRQKIADSVSLEPFAEKIIPTDHLFTRDGFKYVSGKLKQTSNKKVVIIGGSHSAFASMQLLLHKIRGVNFDEGDICLLHRGKLKLFYPTKEQALIEGYTDFTEEDICPLTKKVYRLAGLRMESRELLKRVLGVAGLTEKRIKRITISSENAKQVKDCLETAEIIIPAFGYKPRTIPLYIDKKRVRLAAENGGPLVNKYCRVVDEDLQEIENVFGIGLASGFVPWGELGGEPGFKGQTNGLWLYQNGVGAMIFNQIMGPKRSGTVDIIKVA